MTRRPVGAAVVVWRRGEAGVEFLVLHRSVFEPGFAGDWAWGPPGGELAPDEEPAVGAARELVEETGLDAECLPTPCGGDLAAVFHAEAAPDATVALSAEHHEYRWLPLADAQALCLPRLVADQLACVAELVAQSH